MDASTISSDAIFTMAKRLAAIPQPRFVVWEMSDWAWENWGKYAYAEQEGMRAYLADLMNVGMETE